jgi:hypothetical protein
MHWWLKRWNSGISVLGAGTQRREAAPRTNPVRRSAPAVDCVPTLKTANSRICLLLPSGQVGLLRIDDAERLQVAPAASHPLMPVVVSHCRCTLCFMHAAHRSKRALAALQFLSALRDRRTSDANTQGGSATVVCTSKASPASEPRHGGGR